MSKKKKAIVKFFKVYSKMFWRNWGKTTKILRWAETTSEPRMKIGASEIRNRNPNNYIATSDCGRSLVDLCDTPAKVTPPWQKSVVRQQINWSEPNSFY